MKKFVSILCLAVLAISLLAPALSSAEQTAWVKTGNGKELEGKVTYAVFLVFCQSLKNRGKEHRQGHEKADIGG